MGAVHEGRGAEYLTDICLMKPQMELCGACLAQASVDGDSVFKEHCCRDEPSCSIHDLLLKDAAALDVVKSDKSAAIVAGPGAGKTKLLAQRASYLLETNTCKAPRRILAISFKRDAAKNLKDRVTARAGEDLGMRLESYTFDAFAKSIIDRFRSALPTWCRPERNYEIIMPSWQDWNDFADSLRRSANISMMKSQDMIVLLKLVSLEDRER